MKMVSKFGLALLAGVLVLPMAGFAAEQKVDAPKPAVAAKQKPKVDAPADCKVKGKRIGSAAAEKRKKIHAAKGLVAGEETIVNHKEAASKHGKMAGEVAAKGHGKN